MKSKPDDVKYCGVNKLAIEDAEPILNWENVAHFKDFVIDRYHIHKRKDVQCKSAPWTMNEILREFKFTNVRREHDRQTWYLLKNITFNEALSFEEKILNSFMFRAWNNWLTLEAFGFPYSARSIYSSRLKETVRPIYNRLNLDQPDRMWWSNAYNQGGTKAAWKFPAGDGYQRAYKEEKAKEYSDWEADIPLRPFHIGPWLNEQSIVKKLLRAKDQQEAFETIKSVRGFADFLAYQVFVDLTYIPEFPFSENEFVVAGPGCKKGLDYIFKDYDGMNYAEAIFWLRDNINTMSEGYCLFTCDDVADIKEREWNPNKLFNDLPEYDRCMNVMSIENCMCELSKYIRAVTGTGRPRNKYKGGK